MAKCEDYPCCGHTPSDPCPDRDSKGNIIPRCVGCNKRLSRSARSSICAKCQRNWEREDDIYGDRDYDR